MAGNPGPVGPDTVPVRRWFTPAGMALGLLRVYKILISPLFAGSCRFLPSCADYTAEAVRRHGVLAGVWLGSRRLTRCHPFGGSGFDPVPRVFSWWSRGGSRNTAATACRNH